LGSAEEKEYGFYMDRRQKLLNRLAKQWREFQDSYEDLSEAELLKPGVIGSWSVKDIIAHATTWEEEALKHLPLLLEGVKPVRYSVKYGGIDAFNAQTTAKKRGLSLSEVIRQQDGIHRKPIALIENVSDEHLDSKSRFCHRLRLDTYGHYRKHAEAIKKWRNIITNYELWIQKSEIRIQNT
jgi:hypothetical protein